MYSLNGRECFYYIIRHYKHIVIMMILGALFVGAYKGYKEIVNWSENLSNQEQAALNYEQDYAYVASIAEIYNRQIEEEQSTLAGLKDFSVDSSVNALTSTTIYLAETELEFYSTLPDGSYYPLDPSIVELFNRQIDEYTDWDVVAEVGSINPNTAQCMFFSEVDAEDTSIKLKLYATNDHSCSEMMDLILSYCEALEEDFENEYTGLHMNVSDQSHNIASAREVNEIYENTATRITECETRINDLQNSINSLSYPQKPSTIPYALQVCKRVVKYMGLGVAVGFGGAIVLLYLLFYMNGNIHSEEEYEYYVNSFVLAMWKGGTPHRGISHLIAVKENHGLIYDRVETVDRLLANIVSSDPSVSRVVFTASDADEELDSIREYVKNSNHTIKNFVFAPDILRDTEALSALEQGSVVVLLEYIDKCPISVLKKEVEQIKVSGSRIIGAIILR